MSERNESVSGKKDLTGMRFGALTVEGDTKERKKGYIVWRCRCDCGKEAFASTRELQRGSVRNCGCVKAETARRGNVAEDLRGRVFGKLTVLRRVENRRGRTCWLCRCECGGQKEATARDLKAGKVKSCGCAQHESSHNRLELTGRRFGRLTVMYPTERRDKKGSVYWHCHCDCGNETEVTASALMYNNYQSCGCLKAENQKTVYERLHCVDGTCVEILEKRKHRCDNRSGFRGVFLTKNGNYKVSIGFRGKRYHIGTSASFEKAVRMRLEAEHLLHDGFLEQWYRWKERADQDCVWGEEHPFHFESRP